MLDKLIEWDQELFLFLNSKNTAWLDPVMLALSSYIGWIIVFVAMALFIYLKAKSWKKTSAMFFMLSVGMSALLTNIIKLFFERPRPIHNEAWKEIIHAIEKYSTSYSFFSSHSATTFTMAVFFYLVFAKDKVYRYLGWLGIIWATGVAYSRIYVAKHYPIDVMVGILFGITIGIVGYKSFEYYKKKKTILHP